MSAPKEYYVFPNIGIANASLNAIHGSGMFPIRGKVRGRQAPESHPKITGWMEAPREMSTGEFAVERIPTHLLDYVSYPTEARLAFLEIHGQDIRTLNESDFIQE